MPSNHRTANIPEHKCEACGDSFRRYVSRRRAAPKFCGRACVYAKGARSNPAPEVHQRFWSKVNKTDGCWMWIGGRSKDGYGSIKIDGQSHAAHVLSWEMHNGRPVATGERVLHRCDNPPCIRPDHLFLGTQRDNMRDMVEKGRGTVGSPILCEAQVRDIRSLYAEGGTSIRELARRFSVSAGAVDAIIQRRNWKHVS